MASVAPSRIAIGRMASTPTTVRITLSRMPKSVIMEKYLFACSLSPSPSTRETSAVPPVPSIKPIAPRMMRNGIIRLMDANAVFPAKFDTNNPSTTP